MALGGCKKIYDLQKQALKSKYQSAEVVKEQ